MDTALDTALAAAARVFLEHEGGRFPDFSPCLILLPHHHAGVAFRRALAAAYPGRVLLPPRLMTLPELAGSVKGQGEMEADCVRLAELQHFLARTGQIPRAVLWPAARELAALLDELDEQGLDLPASAPSENRHLSLEAGITQAVWQAWSLGDKKSRKRDYGERLSTLAASAAHTPLYTLGLAGLTRLEQEFLAHWQGQVIDLPAPPAYPQRLALLDAVWRADAPPLAQRGRDFAQSQCANPFAGAVELLAAPSLEAAAQTAEATLLDWLAEGRRDIAIVALDRLAARRLRALMERRGVLMQDETGWAFTTAAASHVIDRWLNVVVDDAWFRDLIDLIKSPFLFCDAERLRQAAIDGLEKAWRRHGAPLGLAGHLALAREQDLAAATAILTRIERARGLFPDAKRPLADWCERLLHALDQLAATQALSQDPVGKQLLTLLATLTRETAGHAQRYSLAEWRRWLYLQLEQSTFADHRVQSPIRLTHLNAARLRAFEGLIVLGVDAARLPGVRPASVFNDATRIQLGLPGAAEREAETRAALADVIARSDRVALIWQAQQAGEERPLSPWLLRVQTFLRAGWGVEWAQECSPDAALRHPGPTSEPVAPVADRLPERITVSAWQSLINCPYQFYARHLLGLNELDDVPEEMDKADYGSLVHKTLAEFHTRHPVLSEVPRETLSADLLDLTRQVFAPALERSYLAEAWALRWQKRHAVYLDWALQREADGYAYTQSEAPLARDIDWAADRRTRLEGRADRLDRKGEAISLLDYKTQKKQALKRKLDETAEDVQLTAYAWLADAAEAGFVSLDDDTVATYAWENDLAAAAAAEGERLHHTFTALAAGSPLPANAAPETCAWCEMRGLCRREHLADDRPGGE